jgi:hypothetical protein
VLGRLLHDRTADKIAGAVSRIPHCVATIVPFDVRSRLEVLHARQAAEAAKQTKPTLIELATKKDQPAAPSAAHPAAPDGPAGSPDGPAGKLAPATPPAGEKPSGDGASPDGPAGAAAAGSGATPGGADPKPAPPGLPVPPMEGLRRGRRPRKRGGDPARPVSGKARASYDRPAPPPGVNPIGSIHSPGRATVEGRVRAVEIRPVERSSVLACEISDSTGDLTALFYGRSHIPGIICGSRVRFRGPVGMREDGPIMINPAYELLSAGGESPPRRDDSS